MTDALSFRLGRAAASAACVAALLAAAGCSGLPFGQSARAEAAGSAGGGQTARVELSGAAEVPPVNTAASGRGSITVRPDRTVTGSVTTSGIEATMAHIHMAAPGANGPVIVPLTRTGDSTWSVPAGAALTEPQLDGYRAGNLYVNVHSAAHPGGEIRGQLRP